MQLNENSLIETMFDVMPFAVYVVDVKTLEIIHMNRVMVKLRGGNHSGRICHKALYEIDSRCIHCKIEEILNNERKPNGISLTYEHFDDIDDCWYQIQDKAITWPDGRVVKCSIAVDISELKDMQNHLAEAHAELALKNIELEKATRHKSEFLANISHEIKTPLNAVIGLSNLVLKTELSLKQQDYLKKIHRSSGYLLKILDDILDFSKIEAGRIDLENLPFELPQVLSEIFDMFYHTSSKNFIKLMLAIDRNVPRFVVGDPFRLGQILSNLISNAIKFTDSGQILINVDMINRTGKHATIQFSVSDTGIGISDEIVPNLFKSFTQADASTTRKYGGTGLGLAICKKMVELMNGSIWVESIKGKGSTFAFKIDIELQDKNISQEVLGSSEIKEFKLLLPNDQIEIDIVKTTHIEPAARKALQLKQILLVDDNCINRQVAKELMEHAGIIVHTASSGEEAIEMAITNSFDAILMDVSMPGMDGYEATRCINKHLQNKIPVIAMTSFSGTKERQKAIESGMNDFICKPVDPDLLYSTLTKWISENKNDHINTDTCGKTPAPETLDTFNSNEKTNMESDIDQVMQYFATAAANKTKTASSDAEPHTENCGGNLLDTVSGIRRLAGNVALYQELLNQYIHDTLPRVAQLKQTLQQGDFQDASKIAHYIKGVSGNIGLCNVFKSSSRLETFLNGCHHDSNSSLSCCHEILNGSKNEHTNENLPCNEKSSEQSKQNSTAWELYSSFETDANQGARAIKEWFKYKDNYNFTTITSPDTKSIESFDKSHIADVDIHEPANQKEDIDAELRKLHLMLKESNTQAIEQIDVVMAFGRVASIKESKLMAEKIVSLDFDSALEFLHSVAAKLAITI